MKQADKERQLQEIEQALFRFNRLLIDLKPEKTSTHHCCTER